MNLSPPLRARMEEIGIDVPRSSEILENINSGIYDNVEPIQVSDIPDIDGKTVLDRRKTIDFSIDEKTYRQRLQEIAPEIPLDRFGRSESGIRQLNAGELETIGVLLYPYLSYGVLNGGSATSYADRIKNESFDEQLFKLFDKRFSELAAQAHGRPKGLTPAYLNPDGSVGASFLELKFRMIAAERNRYYETARRFDIEATKMPPPLTPVYEMTSLGTETAIRSSYDSWTDSPYLAGLRDIDEVLSTEHRVQPLISAFTHSSVGSPRRFFDNAHGKDGAPLGLPGGHGENFRVLAPVYRSLRANGKRFAYLGNVDNLGYTVDPVAVALLAFSTAPAGFEFVFRTPVDVKVGVLVCDQNKRLNCADIGAAIAKDDVLRFEQSGKRILVNCATGLFKLDNLDAMLTDIPRALPMRISDQVKDAGRYSQAEQVTWEIIALLDSPLIFGVDKYRRLLAAKMLVETLLTSGVRLSEAQKLQASAGDLHRGLQRALAEVYKLTFRDGRWRAM